jgi:hypothetical protein
MGKVYPDNLPLGQYSRCYNIHKKKIIKLVSITTITAVLIIIIISALSQCNIAYSCESRNLSSIYLTTYRKFKH